MPIWNKTDTKPQYLTKEEKRNIIVTDIGFVRRQRYTDVHGNTRVKDQIYNAISGLANSTNWGTPKVVDMWHQPVTFANTAGVTVNTYVLFSEPVRANTTLKLTVSGTEDGNTVIAKTPDTTTYIANNTVIFKWKPTKTGTYKVQAQTISNAVSGGGIPVRSLNSLGETASLVIGGAVSNTAGTVVVS